MDFVQQGVLQETAIKRAPIMRVRTKIHVECTEGKIQPLQCCVQSPYKVKWFLGATILPSGKYEGML